MIAVLATAIATWVLILVLEPLDLGGFLFESTIAVLGGAAIGFFSAWFIRRRQRRSR